MGEVKHEGVYIHYTAMGWVLMTVRHEYRCSPLCQPKSDVHSEECIKSLPHPTFWAGKPEFNSFASARIGALRQATGLDLPYGGECSCVSCANIPRNIWSDLKRKVITV